MEKILEFDKLGGIGAITSKYGRMGNDYICASISADVPNLGVLGECIRIPGLTLCLVKEGTLKGLIDSDPFSLGAYSLLAFGSNNVVRFDHSTDARVELMVISPQFIRDLNIDLNAIDLKALMDNADEPFIPGLSEHEASVISRYMHLLYNNACDNTEEIFTKNIGRSLMQALLYQTMQLRQNQRERTKRQSPSGTAPVTRQRAYVQDFMRLLQLYHMRHRSITFYADKLCISPKYLSHIIKESTGRSASEIISQFVILEAKNMLRFSNKSVQQVACDMNFPTQSSFGKYFKHNTGMSPSEYQKT